MTSHLDLDGDDVIDATELVESIDWSAIPPPPTGSGIAVTSDGRQLNSAEEFFDWLAETRRARA